MLTISPEELKPGEKATITITGSSNAGSTVDVVVDNGLGDSQKVSVTLDDTGAGSAEWTAPDSWTLANFNYSSCAQVTRSL